MRIFLLGFGAVGQGFAELLDQRATDLAGRHGLRPRIVAVADRGGLRHNPKGLAPRHLLLWKKKRGTVAELRRGSGGREATLAWIDEIEAEVLVETTPTNLKDAEPGLSHIRRAFKAGKHVITTNKGPLALHLPVLLEAARYHGVHFRFSGTVGGGTPILEFGHTCLLADRIVRVRGILNGTTNYILTQMEREGRDFASALALAQQLGYAEADPTLDVDGWDTASKVVILANWLMRRPITLKDVRFEGIRTVTPRQVRDARNRGAAVKLVGEIDRAASARPREVRRTSAWCVDGPLNAVEITSESAGEEVVVGRGAGGRETASAVLRDLLAIREALGGH